MLFDALWDVYKRVTCSLWPRGRLVVGGGSALSFYVRDGGIIQLGSVPELLTRVTSLQLAPPPRSLQLVCDRLVRGRLWTRDLA